MSHVGCLDHLHVGGQIARAEHVGDGGAAQVHRGFPLGVAPAKVHHQLSLQQRFSDGRVDLEALEEGAHDLVEFLGGLEDGHREPPLGREVFSEYIIPYLVRFPLTAS